MIPALFALAVAYRVAARCRPDGEGSRTILAQRLDQPLRRLRASGGVDGSPEWPTELSGKGGAVGASLSRRGGVAGSPSGGGRGVVIMCGSPPSFCSACSAP